MSRYPADQTGAVTPVPLTVGQRVKLDDDQNWWTVRAVSGHFAALTQPETDPDILAHLGVAADYYPDGLRRYTVLDWRNGVRGPCDLVGQGWGDGSYTEDECGRMLAQFEARLLEVTQRNWLPIVLAGVEAAA